MYYILYKYYTVLYWHNNNTIIINTPEHLKILQDFFQPLSSLEPHKELQENLYFCFINYAKAFDCVDHSKVWKISKEMRVPDHLSGLLRNPMQVKKQHLQQDMEK